MFAVGDKMIMTTIRIGDSFEANLTTERASKCEPRRSLNDLNESQHRAASHRLGPLSFSQKQQLDTMHHRTLC